MVLRKGHTTSGSESVHIYVGNKSCKYSGTSIYRFSRDGENKRMRENDQSGKLLHITWCVQILRSPDLFKKNYSSQESENAVISQRNHPVDAHIFHNAHATIAWPQQTLFRGSF